MKIHAPLKAGLLLAFQVPWTFGSGMFESLPSARVWFFQITYLQFRIKAGAWGAAPRRDRGRGGRLGAPGGRWPATGKPGRAERRGAERGGAGSRVRHHHGQLTGAHRPRRRRPLEPGHVPPPAPPRGASRLPCAAIDSRGRLYELITDSLPSNLKIIPFGVYWILGTRQKIWQKPLQFHTAFFSLFLTFSSFSLFLEGIKLNAYCLNKPRTASLAEPGELWPYPALRVGEAALLSYSIVV